MGSQYLGDGVGIPRPRPLTRRGHASFRWGWACKPNRRPPTVIGSTRSGSPSRPSRSSGLSSLASGRLTAISASSFAGLSAPSHSTSPRATATKAVTGSLAGVTHGPSPCHRLGSRQRRGRTARRGAARSRRSHAASAGRPVLSRSSDADADSAPDADADSRKAESRRRPPISEGRCRLPKADPEGDYSSLTAESDVSVGRGAGGAKRSSSPSTITLSCLYAGRPVPAGIRRPMMTFSLRPRR